MIVGQLHQAPQLQQQTQGHPQLALVGGAGLGQAAGADSLGRPFQGAQHAMLVQDLEHRQR
ncbi:hypothetical protein ODR33_07190 [Pseudomonas aestus]|nr:hypothetical protein [Pseudomonas piscis]